MPPPVTNNAFKCTLPDVKDPNKTCSSSYKQKQHLTDHIKKKHSGAEKLQCPEEGCERTCSSQAELTAHINEVHRGIRPHVCSQCNSSFKKKDHLETHMQSIHSDERNFECSWIDCDKKYKTSQDLRRHVVRHHEKA